MTNELGQDAETSRDLIAGARAGAAWALTELFRRTHPALVRYLHARVPGEEEDLASDVWLELAHCLPRYEGDLEGFTKLAFTIARRRAIDHGRKRARRRTDPVDNTDIPSPVDEAGPELAVVERAAAMEAVERIRSLLPAEQAEVVLLRIVGGLSVPEVAEILGRRPGAISVLQHRALRRLAARLGST